MTSTCRTTRPWSSALKHPDPAIVPALTVFNTQIMPEKAFEASPGDTDADKAKAFAEHPIGSGPFMFESWERGSEMKLVRNPYYWRMGDDGKALPYLDGINFEVIPDDATRILKLKAGELDGAEFIPYARVDELKSDADLNMVLFPSTRVEYVTMNVRPRAERRAEPALQRESAAGDELRGRQERDHPGRHAWRRHADDVLHVDRDAAARRDEPLYPVDVEKAKSLMKEAGFADGFSTSVLVLAGNQDEIGIATALQQMWGAIGIKLELEQVDNATRTDKYRNGVFTMRISAWTDDIADPNEITSYFAYSPTIDCLHSGWKSEEVDKLFEASQSETDPAKRAEQYARIQEIFNTTGPTLPLYETPYPVALRKNVKGFVQIPLGNNIFAATYLEK